MVACRPHIPRSQQLPEIAPNLAVKGRRRRHVLPLTAMGGATEFRRWERGKNRPQGGGKAQGAMRHSAELLPAMPAADSSARKIASRMTATVNAYSREAKQ